MTTLVLTRKTSKQSIMIDKKYIFIPTTYISLPTKFSNMNLMQEKPTKEQFHSSQIAQLALHNFDERITK